MFNNIIGQNNLKKLLERSIRASLQQKTPLSHFCLASGTGGTGKTLFIEETAKEMNVGIKILSSSDAKPDDVVLSMRDLNENRSIVFLEEWNNKNAQLDYFLRPFLESGIITTNSLSPAITGKTSGSLKTRNKYTMAIATNNISVLPQPLQSRLRIFQMEPYSLQELCDITDFHSNKLGVNFADKQTYVEISLRSRGVPRNIVNMLRALKDENIVSGKPLSEETVLSILQELGIYDGGINRLDIKVLQLLANNGGLSLSALSNATGESQETVRDSEAFLITKGYMNITNRRNITKKGKIFLNSL